ncbi:hypothetical protein EOL73_03195 [Candidatus Saccharibacteria bacterium]|nr:hypothetical protein [Candidatus Saccharibacteria bacterium]NCU40735.1 hypothetical protein [Candidatus Saccharibacteria bacterium]
MKKSTIIFIVTTVLVGGGALYYFLVFQKSDNNSVSSTTVLSAAQEQGQPTRGAEIKGIVKSIEGNELIVENEINTVELTDEEKAAKKTERQSMSQEERQAIKAEETAQAEIEQVNITIPVGITMMKSTGEATGELVVAELAEIKSGIYVSIWVKNYQTDTAEVEFVKVRMTEQ